MAANNASIKKKTDVRDPEDLLNTAYRPEFAQEMLAYCMENNCDFSDWVVHTKTFAAFKWSKRYQEFAEAVKVAKQLRVRRLEKSIERIGEVKEDHKAHQFLLSATKKYKQKPNNNIIQQTNITEQIATATPDQLMQIAKAIEDRLIALPASETITGDNNVV